MAGPLAGVPPTGAAQPAHESPVICLTERRIASDGAAYTFAEFVEYYGWENGIANWQQAECGDSVEQHASTPAASQLTYVLWKDMLDPKTLFRSPELSLWTQMTAQELSGASSDARGRPLIRAAPY